jgi:single-strand DNA-binding protein
MRGMNKVFLTGVVGRDPEVRQTRGGGSWCTFSLATNRPKRDGDAWVEEVDWHEIKVFGADAERCGRYLKKGSVASVQGEMHYERWTDDAGARRTSARVVADEVAFVSNLRESSRSPVVAEEEVVA